ncbi:MAG TPA: 4-(cytidine 5'-diphospho)-2-C-methyl-D-erythritol kinase [Microbacteriaceae bacterium]|jgi:4-diphosphocytidyl-2-C-methyl-D-erythritol kinase|nr:4-(cytidine 5'-diphospho)-2-C-methyl-D-erythritol kinase [Microbacteriaceae bacterium]HQZ48641.1 4-(cytidine 5'-diphospho)-2-C-methyl-D-erythritol kinase [Microbacteriaceae bacterium]HRA08712.1 4-(cytidine 5'-diphospho)-2-C-methyl-D-erythritol kinase [Microbacteriaceae bacterium]
MTRQQEGTRVHVRAPGKINVYLEIGALLDDGYHEVATAYQAVSVYEDLYATLSDDFTIEVSGTADLSGVPTDDRNLAIRAAKLLAHTTGYTGGVHLRIEKHVPVAGGMGGGSADAAAALLACDTLWGTGLSAHRLHELAARLGADVPFALQGGTAIGTGRGDELSPALAKGRFEWVLVVSDEGMSTPEVYDELDIHRQRYTLDIAPPPSIPSVDTAVLHALRAGDPAMLSESIRNDLQAPALSLRPDLAEVLELGETSGALAGLISGSGPTIAFLAPDANAARELEGTLQAAGLRTIRAHGPVAGARVMADRVIA